jgi:thiamine kinase-like enzyme
MSELGVPAGRKLPQCDPLFDEGLKLVARLFASGDVCGTENQIEVTRVSGGANNAIFRMELGGQAYACKLCVDDERHRSSREYQSLRLLAHLEMDLAPAPVGLDESLAIFPFPAVIYRWLPGFSLQPPLDQGKLEALLDSLQRLHSCRPEHVPDFHLQEAWFHWFDFDPYLKELDELLNLFGAWIGECGAEGKDIFWRLTRLVELCQARLTGSRTDPSRRAVPACLCRVDTNLANAIWCHDERLRWVDWEYSGWGDPAMELADVRWHAALVGLSDEQHDWLRQNYRPATADRQFAARLAAWDCLMAARWPFLILRRLWSEANGPDRVRLTQPEITVEELASRLVFFVDRAEKYFQSP